MPCILPEYRACTVATEICAFVITPDRHGGGLDISSHRRANANMDKNFRRFYVHTLSVRSS